MVAAITPWNYPVSMITRKVGPALAAGCTVVLKPAEQTPLCAVAVFQRAGRGGLPPGVVQPGDHAATRSRWAEVLLGADAVRKLTFTGSTEVGKSLAAQAAGTVKRVSLELGGHAPFLVFDDADPVHAAKGAAAGEVPEHRAGLHLAEPDLRPARIDPEFLTVLGRGWPRCGRATALTRASPSAR